VQTTSIPVLAGKAGGLAAQRPADDPEVIDAKRALKAERAARHLEEVLGQAPRLTEEQLDRLAAIIRGAR
jgi:hypothetical protein